MRSVIERIKQRPILYLGSESITSLWHFILGYSLAKSDYNLNESKKSILPLDFELMHEYVGVRLGVKNDKGWCVNILDSCGGDEKAALHKFFELYEDFSSAEIKRCERAVLTEENIRHNNSMLHGYSVINGEKAPIYREPKAVYILELPFGTVISVETAEGFVTRREIFENRDGIRERILSYVESFFGKVDGCEEVSVS